MEEKKGSTAPSTYNDALEELMTEVMPELDKGKALDMGFLHVKYQSILKKHIPPDEAMSYTRHKLKSKIETNYGQAINFFPSAT